MAQKKTNRNVLAIVLLKYHELTQHSHRPARAVA